MYEKTKEHWGIPTVHQMSSQFLQMLLLVHGSITFFATQSPRCRLNRDKYTNLCVTLSDNCVHVKPHHSQLSHAFPSKRLQVPALRPPSQPHLSLLCLRPSQWTATPPCKPHPTASRPQKPCTLTGFMPIKVRIVISLHRFTGFLLFMCNSVGLIKKKWNESAECYLERTDAPKIAFRILFFFFVWPKAVANHVFAVSQLRVLSWTPCSRLIRACSTTQVSITGHVICRNALPLCYYSYWWIISWSY